MTDSSESAVDADAVFAFVYPNLMINAYGPWVDTNLVMPLSVDSCCVQFDWYVMRNRANDQQFIEDSIAASHEVRTPVSYMLHRLNAVAPSSCLYCTLTVTLNQQSCRPEVTTASA
jgi:hypothetical protein